MTEHLHATLEDTVAALDGSIKPLLQAYGPEDRGAIFWASFSDDDGKTRIIYRGYKSEARKRFASLTANDLKAGLLTLRRHDKAKAFWGLIDDVVN